jgi:hypothetical protein
VAIGLGATSGAIADEIDAVLTVVDPTYFDFAPFEVAEDLNLDECSFVMKRYEPAIDKSIMRARGYLQIQNGRIAFGYHSYAGMARSSPKEYLHDQTNLAVTTAGMVVGRMPFFWKETKPGEVEVRPNMVTLAKSHDPSETFPAGRTWFEIEEVPDFLGTLELVSCY